jgi:transposase
MDSNDRTLDDDYLPDNLAECHKVIKDLRAEVKRLAAIAETVALLQQRVAELEKQVRRRNRKIFGKSSAKVPAESLTGTGKTIYDSYQPNIDAERAALQIVPEEPKHGGGGRNIPKTGVVPRTIEHKITDPAKLACPCCGQQRLVFGFKVSEQLDVIKTAFELLKHVEYKYSCPHCDGQVIEASKPYQPIDKGLPAPGLIAHVAVSKFDWHLPLYRQQRIYLAQSVSIARSSMCRWLKEGADLLRVLVERMRELALASRFMQSDTTSMPVIKNGLGKTHQGCTWLSRDERYIIYDFTENENGEHAERLLAGFNGILLTDGAAEYNRVIKKGARRAGCSAHAFRYLEDAKKDDPEQADAAIAIYKRLFEIEEIGAALSEEERLALRQRQSKPLLADLGIWLDRQLETHLPKTALGEAVTYLNNQWDALCYFADTGFVPMHNNASENGLRPAVLGRRNWLFAGSVDGGHTAAVWMTLIHTCRRHQIDPFQYLKDVLTRLPSTSTSEIDQFLPDVWKANRINPT